MSGPVRARLLRRAALLSALALALPVAASAAGGTPAAAAAAPDGTTAVQVHVLSGRADLVSGGDALVEVRLPTDAAGASPVVTVDGRDRTAFFTRVAPDRLLGLVDGLVVGPNRVRAALADGRGAELLVTNHPQGGPVLAGPQVQPWVCDNPAGGNGPARDAQCNTDVRYEYHYRDVFTDQFLVYNPQSPPGDGAVQRTTTDEGVTVRYVVRTERGVQDRGNYAIAVLAEPGAAHSATAPPPGWNRKLLVPFGGGSAPKHGSGAPTAVLDDDALSRGYMVANSSLHVHGLNANDNVSAEALILLKERIVEQYGGPIRYTISNGCSGGALQQTMIAAMYPGTIDGVQPSCSFADLWSAVPEVEDCKLLAQYFNVTSPALWADERDRAEVDGHRDHSDCEVYAQLFAGYLDPDREQGCGLPDSQVYSPQTNPGGVRCTLQDYQQAVWGPRVPASWTAVEQALGRGFAQRPLDNVGKQYGLKALQKGQITAAQFVDLNTKVGGLDIDFEYSKGRMAADAGSLVTAYRTGQVVDARLLEGVPIIDLRGYSETAEIHNSYHSYRMRARLDERNGHHDNHLIWTFQPAVPILPTPTAGIARKSFLLMDRWLAAVEADTSSATRAQKVRANKPADALDGCYVDGERVLPDSQCGGTAPPYDDATGVAGGPLEGDVLKCRLKPIDTADYAGRLSAAQVESLRSAFPDGVCDWTQPGVDEQPTVPWLTFADGPGGRPLGAAPVSVPFGPGTAGPPAGGRPTTPPTTPPSSPPTAPPTTPPTDEPTEPPRAAPGPVRTLDSACPQGQVPPDSQVDDDTNTHERAIECMVWWEIARGTSAATYDPGRGVTRAQMASFVARLVERSGGSLPADPPDRFPDDDADTTHEPSIDKLAAVGIVVGGADGRYEPGRTVTRAQMATFLVRAYLHRSDGTLDAEGDVFDDDDGDVHEDSINRVAAAGLAAGRDGRYEPLEPVRRDQMAAFLARTLDLLVAEGTTPAHP